MPTSNHAIELIEKVIDDKITAVIKRSSPKVSYGKVTGIKDGVTWVSFPGNNSAPITRRVSDAEIGETVKVTIYSDGTAVLDGSTSSPTPTATGVKRVSEIVASEAVAPISTRLGVVEAETADIKSIRADSIKVRQLTADELEASVAYINDLTAENITAQDITSDHATIANLDATYASIETLEADYAHITSGVIDNATIGYADVNGLSANYASIDLANVNNAWLQNGTIKNAAISNEMVNSVSANKLTAGTIDASKINVANLQAKNLIVEKLNGQPVLGGYELVSPSSNGYSSKNPKTQGWYEYSNGAWTLSNDTSVSAGKSYYKTGSQVELYDQDYIDSLETTLNQRIDGAVETFTGSDIPTLLNYPVTTWDSSSYSSHVGDIYYVADPTSNSNGYCYRFAYDNSTSTYNWVLIKDSDVTKALSDITDLQTFESETSTWISDVDEEISTIKSNHTTLSGVVDDALDLIETKVDATTFNEVKNSVDSNSAIITKLTTRVDSVGVGVTDLSSMDIWELGTLSSQIAGHTYEESKSTSSYSRHDSRIRTSDTLGIQAGKYTVSMASGFHSYFVYFDSNGGLLSNSGWQTESPYTLVVPENVAYYCVVLRLSDNASISSDNVDTVASASKLRVKYSYADSSELSLVSNQVSAIEQTIDGIETDIGNLTTEVESKADGATVTTISNSLNSISDTVSGHTQTISSVQSVANGVRTDFNNLSLGGKNLLRGTEYPVGNVEFTSTRCSITSDGIIRVGGTSSYSTFAWDVDYLDYAEYGPGKYTLSFDIRLADNDTEYDTLGIGVYVGYSTSITAIFAGATGRYIRKSLTDLAYNWKRISWTVSVPEDLETGTASVLAPGSYLRIEAYTAGSTVPVEFKNIKLERGSVATDYQPAPYDTIPRGNLLRGTNQDIDIIPYGGIVDPVNQNPTTLEIINELWATGRCRVFSGNETNGDAEIFYLNDPPHGDRAQQYGIRVWSTTTGNKDVGFGCPAFTSNTDYTMSCWVRMTPGAEQSSVKAQFRIYGYYSDGSSSAVKTVSRTMTTGEWWPLKYRFSFTDEQIEDFVGFVALFGVGGKGDAQYCALKVEEGFSPSPWAPSPFDSLSAYKLKDAEYDISSLGTRVTTAETTIASNSEQIALRATKSEVYQFSQPNLTPFLSYEFGNTDYWFLGDPSIDPAANGSQEILEEGWARIAFTEVGANKWYAYPVNQSFVKTGSTYTLLLEIRNHTGAALAASYTAASTGSNKPQLIRNDDGTATTYESISIDSNGSGELRLSYIADSRENTVFNQLIRSGLQCEGISEFDIRLSLYEGEYTGPYKPYSGTLLYASQAELKVASDAISSKVSTTDFNGNTISSLINQTATTVQIDASKVNINGVLTLQAFDGTTKKLIQDGARNMVSFNDKWEQGTWVSASGAHNTSTTRVRNTKNGNNIPVTPGIDYVLSWNSTMYDMVIYGYNSGSLVNDDSKKTWLTSSPFVYKPTTATVIELGVRKKGNGTITADEAINALVMLEKGSEASGYFTLSPEDVSANIGDAAKTASNYIQIDPNAGSLTLARSNLSSEYPRVLIDTSSVNVMQSATAYSSVTANGLEVYTTSNSVASFGSTTRIGPTTKAHMLFDSHSVKLLDKNDNVYFHVSDLRDDTTGYAELVDYFTGDGITTAFSTGIPFTTVVSVEVSDSSGGTISFPTDSNTGNTYIKFFSAPTRGAKITVDYFTNSDLAKAYTFGITNGNSNIGAMSIREGINTAATGKASHAEGFETEAYEYSHAEGYQTRALGGASHSEGVATEASGPSAHSEGTDTIASGYCSHAQNYGTIASGRFQTAMGLYNEAHSGAEDDEEYLLIVGNGFSENYRSNAMVLTYSGDLRISGRLQNMSGAPLVLGNVSLTTVTNTGTLDGSLSGGATDSINVVIAIPSGYVPVPLTQQIFSNNRTWRHIAGWSVSVSGSTATYTVDVCNSSSSTASNITVSVTAAFVQTVLTSS